MTPPKQHARTPRRQATVLNLPDERLHISGEARRQDGHFRSGWRWGKRPGRRTTQRGHARHLLLSGSGGDLPPSGMSTKFYGRVDGEGEAILTLMRRPDHKFPHERGAWGKSMTEQAVNKKRSDLGKAKEGLKVEQDREMRILPTILLVSAAIEFLLK